MRAMATITRTPTLEVRDLDPQLTACVRTVIPADQLAAAFSVQLPRIATRVRELGGAIAGPPYARYYRWDGDAVDVEIGAPIAAMIPSLPEAVLAQRGDVAEGELPSGPAAVLTFVGPYTGLARGWRRLRELMAEERLHAAAPGWELYVDNPDRTPAAELRTELINPIL